MSMGIELAKRCLLPDILTRFGIRSLLVQITLLAEQPIKYSLER